MAGHDEIASLHYAKWLKLYEVEKPFVVISDLTSTDKSEYRHTNVEMIEGEPEIITDIRGKESNFTLDSHGFEVCSHTWDTPDWSNKDEIERRYFPEVESLLRKQIPGLTEIRIFDWRLRRNVPYREAGLHRIDLNDSTHYLLPATAAHIDQTPGSTRGRVMRHMGDQADALLRGRVRIVNIWRPIKHPVGDWPLALCDGSTVDRADLLATDHVTRDYVGETYNMLYRDMYRWYYLNTQTPDEVLLFKMFDSELRIKARHCPHASFQHRTVPDGTLPRESIEVRALVFSDVGTESEYK
ncbi:methyltransferase CmcJ [Coniochaeta ligniaria NRRL 30616]|uniref:Methyltransferase CmcJ n=1 Tax=Coniochaeta ligniaria NRRL 30616 TaxID=1408157 RepID=A0A1J7JR02_9PEZI|nr:methyltransferase CmcJ [Coniochaeta ligniaria NRRL 30616]